jgi:hypothetical protein
MKSQNNNKPLGHSRGTIGLTSLDTVAAGCTPTCISYIDVTCTTGTVAIEATGRGRQQRGQAAHNPETGQQSGSTTKEHTDMFTVGF